MTITIEAIYENGVLKPSQPLPLAEHEKVQVTVQSVAPQPAKLPDEAERIVRRSYGLLGWTGDAETVRHIALDPDLDTQESA